MPAPSAAVLTVILLAAGLLPTLGGCASTAEGPEVITVAPGTYDEAFDAALEASRQLGLPAVVRDRRAGVIITEPRVVASFLEPWRAVHQTAAATSSGTINMERHRARFEFAPFGAGTSATPGEAALTGPDVIGAQASLTDLTQLEAPLEMRVWVHVERAHRPGVRRSTWSRRLTTTTEIIVDGKQVPRTTWSVVTRDRNAEQRLMDLVRAVMEQPPPEPVETADAG